MIPAANPEALAAHTRTAQFDGRPVDLNRSFPGGSPSKAEAIFREALAADLVLDLHEEGEAWPETDAPDPGLHAAAAAFVLELLAALPPEDRFAFTGGAPAGSLVGELGREGRQALVVEVPRPAPPRGTHRHARSRGGGGPAPPGPPVNRRLLSSDMAMHGFEIAAVLAAGGYFAFLVAESRVLAAARRSLRVVVHVNGTPGQERDHAPRRGGLAGGRAPDPRQDHGDGAAGDPGGRFRTPPAPLGRRQRPGAAEPPPDGLAPPGGSPGGGVHGPSRRDAQRASTAFLEPSILVVTNSRPDHEAELGTPEEALAVFAEGIPVEGLVVTADTAIHRPWPGPRRIAAPHASSPHPGREPGTAIPRTRASPWRWPPGWGISEHEALEAMRRHVPDPGAFRIRLLAAREGGVITVVDALAANDPLSTDQLFQSAATGPGPRWLLLANRARPPRPGLDLRALGRRPAGALQGVLLAGPAVPGVRRILERAWPGKVRRIGGAEELRGRAGRHGGLRHRELEGPRPRAAGN